MDGQFDADVAAPVAIMAHLHQPDAIA